MFEGLKDKFEGFGSGLGVGVGLLGGLMAKHAGKREGEIEDADDAPLDEVDEDREPLAGHLVAGELDDEVVDGTEFQVV